MLSLSSKKWGKRCQLRSIKLNYHGCQLQVIFNIITVKFWHTVHHIISSSYKILISLCPVFRDTKKIITEKWEKNNQNINLVIFEKKNLITQSLRSLRALTEKLIKIF